MKRTAIVAGALFALLGVVTLANVSGAIYTSISDGTTVNANIYESKAAVYLNGGPQNHNAAGLSPDGDYYFQITDPSGAVLLSEDDLACRVVRVTGGRIVGRPGDNAGGSGTPGCYHSNGVANGSNGGTAVAMMPFADTPNNGGEYKAWLTPVQAYGTCGERQSNHGFCNAESKTDNFKVRSVKTAYVSVCKFNDRNGDGYQNHGEPFIPHWPITASGVDNSVVNRQTDDDGCVSLTVSRFDGSLGSQTVTLSEGSFGGDWTQTAPLDCGATPDCSVTNGAITLVVRPGDDVQAPAFGNMNPFCDEGCVGNAPVLTATAFASLTRTYAWQISKSADRSRITTANSQTSVNYTVTVTHDAGVDSNWQTTGMLRLSNPGGDTLTNATIATLLDNGGTCTVTGPADLTLAPGSHQDLPYTCDYTSAPSDGTLSATATWAAGTVSTTEAVSTANAVVNMVDEQVAIDDTLAGPLGTLSAAETGPFKFDYSKTINGVPGTCVSTQNVATFTTNDSAATDFASRDVELCVGADLQVSTTAAATFQSAITKLVDRTLVEQQGGNVTLNYTISVTESGWTVSGTIAIANPNDWQSVTVTPASTVGGGTCAIAGGPFSVPPSSVASVPYSCTFALAPAASNVQTAAISWDGTAASTPASTASATAPYAFVPLVVTDTFNGSPTTLGTIATPAALTTYAYPRTVANARGGSCQAYVNTASIAGTNLSASQTTNVCNTATGSRTMGFWQNKNGQAIITAGAADAAGCKAGGWLRQLAPFRDLAANPTCRTVAGYATTIIKAASAAGAAMNAMLKAQMLATSLDVFFSDPGLGGNQLAAPVAVGSVMIDLSQVCAAISGGTCNGLLDAGVAFGGATRMTVANMLLFQNGVANAGGTLWYGNIKTVQGLAKNAFDAINNEVAYIAP